MAVPVREELSTEDKEYFKSGGAADLPDVPVETETPDPETKPDVKKEPESKAPVKTEVKEDVKPNIKAEDKAEKTVPLAALQEARKALKDIEAQRFKEQEITQRRLDMIAEAMRPKEQAPVMPNLETDPLAVLKMTREQVEGLVKFRQEFEEGQRQAQERQQLSNEAINQENEFLKEHPDYMEAGNFLKQSRLSELMATGMYNQNQAMQIIQNETFGLIQMAKQQGKNAAELAYTIAKARGFVKVDAPAAGVPNGNTATSPAAETETEKLIRIAAGQNSNKSLSNAGGGALAIGEGLDAKMLANMSEEDFAKVYNKLTKAQRREMM